MDNDISSILTIILILMVILLIIFSIIFMVLQIKFKRQNKKKVKTQIPSNEVNNKENAKEKKSTKAYPITYNKKSIFDFMEFDGIEDNMIVQKDGKRYIMVIECQGINYDLMSQMEKVGVEEGFQQFLNTLRFPIQI